MNSEPMSHEEALAEIERLNRRVGELQKEADDRYRAWDYQHSQAEKYTRVAEALEKRVRSLRITMWETERDAKTALKFLKAKNYENAENICELIAQCVNDALAIDKERE